MKKKIQITIDLPFPQAKLALTILVPVGTEVDTRAIDATLSQLAETIDNK